MLACMTHGSSDEFGVAYQVNMDYLIVHRTVIRKHPLSNRLIASIGLPDLIT